MQEANFTLRVDNALKTAFAEAARRQDRTAAQLVRDYMRSVVQETREQDEYEVWFRARVEAARQEIREGRALAHEEVMAKQAERRSRLLAQADRQAQ
jgi:predicted transcriptional regulator